MYLIKHFSSFCNFIFLLIFLFVSVTLAETFVVDPSQIELKLDQASFLGIFNNGINVHILIDGKPVVSEHVGNFYSIKDVEREIGFLFNRKKLIAEQLGQKLIVDIDKINKKSLDSIIEMINSSVYFSSKPGNNKSTQNCISSLNEYSSLKNISNTLANYNTENDFFIAQTKDLEIEYIPRKFFNMPSGVDITFKIKGEPIFSIYQGNSMTPETARLKFEPILQRAILRQKKKNKDFLILDFGSAAKINGLRDIPMAQFNALLKHNS